MRKSEIEDSSSSKYVPPHRRHIKGKSNVICKNTNHNSAKENQEAFKHKKFAHLSSLWHHRSHPTQMSTAPSSEVEGSEGAANKSYIRHSTSYGSSGSTASAEVCSYQSEWQTKEEQIQALQEKAAKAQWQPWLWRIAEPNTRYAKEYGQHGHDLQTISTGQAGIGQEG
jgi:hypothetical protein